MPADFTSAATEENWQPLRQVLAHNFPDLALPEALLRQAGRLIPSRRLNRGRSLFGQGQATRAFYAVLEGEVEARFTGLDGTVSVLELLQPLQLFGLAAFVTERAQLYEALARQPSRVLLIGPEAYALLMDEWPGFARALMRHFAQRFEGNLRLLEAARHHSAAERFRLALQQLAAQRALPAKAAGEWLGLRATQAELAALANLSRQTVNQLLAQAEAQGQLRRSYGRLWLKPV
ncbi:CRP-like cAMP-binding protein [Paucibacter oligotrophus]|uniref:CRP-like cAMP-binding protein n=1 Tax=Roseateles oligotrophus TaxID=1769250 RepID=A0A840LAX2_9BURK|nr:Crp/Fnr family transcriptional regulator [Roseateles oligotrophus]MBB4843348.1 CRP-like cAMP-binding protein [Roseateles oligotrophus]